jgi:predicted PurR-regulated permease PerM
MSDIGETQPPREWRVAGIIFFALFALVILWATVMIIRPFLTAIILGAVLVTLTFNLFKRVRARLGGRNALAATVMLAATTLLLILPAFVMGGLLVEQAGNLIQHLQSGQTRQVLGRIDIAGRLEFLRRVIPGFDPSTLSLQRIVLPVVQQVPGWVARNGAVVVGGIAGLVVEFVFVLLSMYFFYVEGETILRELRVLSPLPERIDREFAAKFKDVIDATFRGQLFTSIAQGIVTAVGLAIAGVPGALFWGVVATVLSLLPMVGAAAVWVPATIYLYVTASMGQRGYFGAIFLTFWGLLVVSLIDNVVRPWAMKGKAQLPAIPLLLAVIGGMQAFGFIGLVVGPLVFSLLMSIVDIYKTSFQKTAV